MVVNLLRTKKNEKIGKTTFLYSTWLFIAILSSLFGLFYFNGRIEWMNNISSYIPKILLYLFLLVIISIYNKKEEIIHYFFKGFLLGCILNIIWAIIEGVVYYTLGYSLSSELFSSYISTLSLDRQFSSIINSDGIRVAGFNTDPAHLGGIIPIIILYSALNKKYIILILCAIALAFSQSTTALVCSFILLIFNIKKIVPSFKIKITRKRLFYILINLLIFIVTITFLFINNDNQIIVSVSKNTTGFLDRINKNYIEGGSNNPRAFYHIYLLPAVLSSGIKVLTGAGFGISSYPYVLNSEISTAANYLDVFAYDPESNYISYLFNTGIIGLSIYILVLYKNYKFYSKRYFDKEKSLIFASIGGIIVSGFFYHYILTAYQVVILIMASVLMDKQTEETDISPL